MGFFMSERMFVKMKGDKVVKVVKQVGPDMGRVYTYMSEDMEEPTEEPTAGGEESTLAETEAVETTHFEPKHFEPIIKETTVAEAEEVEAEEVKTKHFEPKHFESANTESAEVETVPFESIQLEINQVEPNQIAVRKVKKAPVDVNPEQPKDESPVDFVSFDLNPLEALESILEECEEYEEPNKKIEGLHTIKEVEIEEEIETKKELVIPSDMEFVKVEAPKRVVPRNADAMTPISILDLVTPTTSLMLGKNIGTQPKPKRKKRK